MRFALGFGTAVVLAVVVGLTIMWTGAYNVAASEPHAGIARWVLDTTFHNSVRARSDETAVEPAQVTQANLRTGFQEFREYCVHCHGAPGEKPHEWVSGMTPNPPELSRVAGRWSPDEIFWIVKHGVKMSGMPPFGDTESDETIRNIALFVNRLEGMSPAQYARLKQQWGSSEAGHHGESQSESSGHSH